MSMFDDGEGEEDELVAVLISVRVRLEDARRCLNRPERSPSEAIEHIERALSDIAGFV